MTWKDCNMNPETCLFDVLYYGGPERCAPSRHVYFDAAQAVYADESLPFGVRLDACNTFTDLAFDSAEA